MSGLILVLGLTAALLTGCRGLPDDGPSRSPEGGGPSAGRQTMTLEVYGDSLTVADSPSVAEGRTGPESWLHHLGPHGLSLAGGSGRWGATAGDILDQHLQPPVSAEVLVLFLGTNDLAAGGVAAHGEDYLAALDQIVRRQGYPAQDVVVVAVGPRDAGSPGPVQAWNRRTAEAARERGWHLIDPWGPLRTEGNRYRHSALTTDGLHLSVHGASLLAEGMAGELRRVEAGTA
ncbi:SGNH/GDSL hydrolase family protein [Microbacterium sp. A93]|uniref:SGNH/GDSL hydrolase family protein n=1 Tax=Microbacterium sp. A93 TaxID=3450716 RepID=UPI003F41D8BC